MATNGSAVIGRDDILGGRAFRVREVDIGGRTLRLRELTAAELLELQKDETQYGEKAQDLDAVLTRAAKTLARVAVDHEGKRFLEDGDVPKLIENVSATVLIDAYRTVLGLSGMTEEQVKRLGERSAGTAASVSSTA